METSGTGLSAGELAELDLAVAKADGLLDPQLWKESWHPPCVTVVRPVGGIHAGSKVYYRPTSDGAVALRLLEKYHVDLTWAGERGWLAEVESESETVWGSGPTPAIAICRAVVALREKP